MTESRLEQIKWTWSFTAETPEGDLAKNHIRELLMHIEELKALLEAPPGLRSVIQRRMEIRPRLEQVG